MPLRPVRIFIVRSLIVREEGMGIIYKKRGDRPSVSKVPIKDCFACINILAYSDITRCV